MVFSSSKRRSTGARISFTGGPSEVLFVTALACYICFRFDLLIMLNKKGVVLGCAKLTVVAWEGLYACPGCAYERWTLVPDVCSRDVRCNLVLLYIL
jgi:hypothetical protein